MTRLHHVKKARKAQRRYGIKKGDSYFWWRFRVNGRGSVKRVSKTKPPRSAYLTQSPFLCAMYDAEDGLKAAAELFQGDGCLETFLAAIEQAAEAVREQGQECEEKHGNLPESFRDGAPGELLRERAEACERIADELDGARADAENEEVPDENDLTSEWDEWLTKVAGMVEAVDWNI